MRFVLCVALCASGCSLDLHGLGGSSIEAVERGDADSGRDATATVTDGGMRDDGGPRRDGGADPDVGSGLDAGTAASCADLIGTVGDGFYTIGAPGPVRVFCDMTHDGGGWTLVAYAEDATLGGRLNTAVGTWDPATRTGRASIDASSLVRISTEAAFSWTRSGFPVGGIDSYETAVAFAIPEPSAQTLDPTAVGASGFRCTAAEWTSVDVDCRLGSCGMPGRMYTRRRSLGANYGNSYGLVRTDGMNPQCDWYMDGQAFRAVYVGIDRVDTSRGVIPNPGSISSRTIPSTIAIWFR